MSDVPEVLKFVWKPVVLNARAEGMETVDIPAEPRMNR
jgi:hypothetical protein